MAVAPVAVVAVFAFACGRRPPPRLEAPLLWHGDPGFELLVESRTIAPPPALSGNRFLSGWRGWRTGPRRGAAANVAHADSEAPEDEVPADPAAGADRSPTPPERGGIVYAPFRQRARLEVVQLGSAPDRVLQLDLAPDGHDAGALPRLVHAWAAGRDLGGFPLADPLRIPLPAELPLGRVAIDLELPEGASVERAGLSSALPAGDARVDGRDLLQRGDSLVELYTRVPEDIPRDAAASLSTAAAAESQLVGQFVPPATAGEGSRFELRVENAQGEEAARFSWTPPQTGTVDLALPVESGPLRVRLLARGRDEGRWCGLRIETTHPSSRPDSPPGRLTGVPATSTEHPPGLVVVLVLDALRADHVGHLGAGAGRTPTIDRLAAEGLTFTAHRTVAPNTLPSTKSLFTGRVWRAGGGLSLPRDVPTLAELVRTAGYRTACVSGNQNVSPTFAMTRGFDFDAENVKFPPPKKARATFNDNAARVGAAATAWIRGLRPDERGFLYVHVIHPHNPYDPPRALAERFTGGMRSRIDGSTDTLRAIDRGERATTAADRERLHALYAASLAYADGELAGLVAQATRGRAPGDVVFVITADHGEELFDHGGLLHGYTLFEEMLRIPLVLWSPGRIAPGRVERPTDNIDLFATLLALAGATVPPDTGGQALVPPGPAEPVWGAPRFAAASAVRGGIYGARWGRWKVVLAPRSGLQWGMGSGIGRVRDTELVFDLEQDPHEMENLAGTSNVEVGWLRADLLRWITAGKPESADDAREPVLDEEERSRLKALGYVGN